ncbi:hypothetical protein SLS56_009817 [Neofusicoccum ribis]|uniref:C2H2-type domain-containing protein n=1 Tax=Neofusicoccum ribis TaxID=45134 RepID=A0ABR3SGS3_9PEZI
MDIHRCNQCFQVFLSEHEFVIHQNRDETCERRGVQKGEGQKELWYEMYEAIRPGSSRPISPYYAQKPRSVVHSKSPDHQAQEVQHDATTSSVSFKSLDQCIDSSAGAGVGKVEQPRDAVMQLFKILQEKLVSPDLNALPGDNAIWVELLQELPPLIKNTIEATRKAKTSEILPKYRSGLLPTNDGRANMRGCDTTPARFTGAQLQENESQSMFPPSSFVGVDPEGFGEGLSDLYSFTDTLPAFELENYAPFDL